MKAYLCAVFRMGCVFGIGALAASACAQSRGELLYANHCLACHTAQLHWRAAKVATDWNGLRTQVRRWQGEAKLSWNEDDVLAVTHYLNDSIYHLAIPRATRPTTPNNVSQSPRTGSAEHPDCRPAVTAWPFCAVGFSVGVDM